MPAKKKAPTKREHVYTVTLVAGRVLWTITKVSMVAALALCLMFLAVVGMLVRGVDAR